jgi:hypothetical protein
MNLFRISFPTELSPRFDRMTGTILLSVRRPLRHVIMKAITSQSAQPKTRIDPTRLAALDQPAQLVIAKAQSRMREQPGDILDRQPDVILVTSLTGIGVNQVSAQARSQFS